MINLKPYSIFQIDYFVISKPITFHIIIIIFPLTKIINLCAFVFKNTIKICIKNKFITIKIVYNILAYNNTNNPFSYFENENKTQKNGVKRKCEIIAWGWLTEMV